MTNTNCKLCGGVGFFRLDVPLDDENFGKAIPCDCTMQRMREINKAHIDAWRKWANIPGWRFDYPIDKIAKDSTISFIDDKLTFLVLWGGYGVGKTGLLVAATNTMWERGVPAIYANVPRLLDKLRSTYEDDNEENFDTLFSTLCNTPFLALDEFYRYKASTWAVEKMEILIDYRYINQLKTLVATNFSPDADTMIGSRFRDSLVSRVLEVRGVDMRPHRDKIEVARNV